LFKFLKAVILNLFQDLIVSKYRDADPATAGQHDNSKGVK